MLYIPVRSNKQYQHVIDQLSAVFTLITGADKAEIQHESPELRIRFSGNNLRGYSGEKEGNFSFINKVLLTSGLRDLGAETQGIDPSTLDIKISTSDLSRHQAALLECCQKFQTTVDSSSWGNGALGVTSSDIEAAARNVAPITESYLDAQQEMEFRSIGEVHNEDKPQLYTVAHALYALMDGNVLIKPDPENKGKLLVMPVESGMADAKMDLEIDKIKDAEPGRERLYSPEHFRIMREFLDRSQIYQLLWAEVIRYAAPTEPKQNIYALRLSEEDIIRNADAIVQILDRYQQCMEKASTQPNKQQPLSIKIPPELHLSSNMDTGVTIHFALNEAGNLAPAVREVMNEHVQNWQKRVTNDKQYWGFGKLARVVKKQLGYQTGASGIDPAQFKNRETGWTGQGR